MIERVNFERKTLKRGIAERVIDTKQFATGGSSGGSSDSFTLDFLDYLSDIEEGILWASNKFIVYRIRPKRIAQKSIDATVIPGIGMPKAIADIKLYNYWIGGTLMFISLSDRSGRVQDISLTKDTLRRPKGYDAWEERERVNFIKHSTPFLQLNVYSDWRTVADCNRFDGRFLSSLRAKGKNVIIHKEGDNLEGESVLFANQDMYRLCYGEALTRITLPTAKETISRIGEIVNRVLSAPFNRDISWRDEIVPSCCSSAPEMGVNFIHKFFVKMSRLSDVFETAEQFERWYNTMSPQEIMQAVRRIDISAPRARYLELANRNVN